MAVMGNKNTLLKREKAMIARGIPVTMDDMQAWYDCTKKRHFKIAHNKANRILTKGGKPLLLWKGGATIEVSDKNKTNKPVRRRMPPVRVRRISKGKR